MAQRKPKIAFNKETVVTVGAVVLLFYGSKLLKSLFETLGISQTKEGQEYDQLLADPGSFWNSLYWRKIAPGRPVHILSEANANSLYEEIYDSFGIFNDDEARIYAAFKYYIKYKSQLSYFSEWVNKKKGLDLLRWLHGSNYGPVGDHLSVAEIAVITDYVKGLPNY
jgi:hypothetical protein